MRAIVIIIKMSVILSLVGASLLVAQVFAGKYGMPLVTQTSAVHARAPTPTCPALLHTFDVCWMPNSEENNVCPVESRTDYLNGDGLASNQRDCITALHSSAIYCVYTFSDFARGRGKFRLFLAQLHCPPGFFRGLSGRR